METKSLTILNNATRMLAEVKSIDDAKQVMDIAAAAKVYARKHGLGKEAVGYAREIEIGAEIKLGEILAQMDMNKGMAGSIVSGAIREPVKDTTPTLKEIGITKKESSEAQALASLSDEVKIKVQKGQKTKKSAMVEVKTKKRNDRLAEREQKSMAEKSSKSKFELFNSSVESLDLPENSIDVIICDPPYGKEYLSVYKSLSLLASKVLKTGGPCLVMTGQSHLEEVLRNLSMNLTYQWTLAYLTPGSSVQVFGRKIKSNWKPIIFLTNGKNDWEHVDDVVRSDSEDKRFHEWGQSISGMISIIERFTVKNQIVLDPFCGGGSTGVACLLTDRLFVGSDVSNEEIEKTKKRLVSL